MSTLSPIPGERQARNDYSHMEDEVRGLERFLRSVKITPLAQGRLLTADPGPRRPVVPLLLPVESVVPSRTLGRTDPKTLTSSTTLGK